MLLPIKLATTKQPAKKKGKVTPVTPEEQAKGFEGLKRQAKLEEQQIAEFVAKQNYNPAEEARKRGVSVPVQPYESKLNTGVLAEPVLSGEESVAKAQTEPKVAPRVQVNKQGLVVKTIETKYGNVKYTATPEESKIYLGSNIDAINKLTAEIAKDFENGFRQEGLKPKRQTKEKYKFDEVNAALNPNFIDEQTRKGVKAFEDVLLAPFDTFGIRKSLNEVADYAKQSDNALAQFGGGVLESVANPLTTFAMSTGNIADPTATAEEQTGAAFNLATYLISAIPVGEAVSASINAYRGVRGLAGIGKGINAGAKSLLRNTVPGGKWIDRKITINDLVNVLERNGQMAGKTRGQLAKEFASGGKAFAKATGQAPELFYNKYLNDLANQAQLATPAQFDVTAPKAPEVPTQVEDLGTVVDDLVGKTEPVVPPSTIVEESDLEKLFQETVAPTLTPVKATRTRKPKAETVQPTPPANEDLGAVVDELTAQVESPVVTEPTAPVVEPPVVQEPEPIAQKTSVNTTPEELADPNVSVTQVPFKLDWTDKTSAKNSTNYLQRLKNLFKQNGELGIENIDDLPLLAVTKLHESNFNPKLTRAPINNKTPLPSSVYQKSIEELTYGEFKNMDWRLVPDTEANKDLIKLLKQREEAFNQMVSHFKSNPGKGTTPQWKKVEELLKSRNNVIDPNDIELMDAMWELWSETSVVSEANVKFNRFYGDWFDKEKLRLFGRETRTRTKRATPGTLEQFADDQLEGLQKSWKEARSKMGANIQPEHFEFVARAVAYVISKTGLKLADALVETSKYLKQKFNFDITFDTEDIANIENKLRELNVSFEVSPPPVAPVAVSPTASKSTTPPPPTEPTVTGIPETPEPITSGISNKANLSSEELGLISEAPQGKGRSASQVVEETINRNPSEDELKILAGKVANGQALNADDTAVLLVGQGRFNLRVFNAREALDNAIKSGASAQDIDQLRDAWLLAQADATNFAKQIQRGKSGWSDVGRVLQQKTDLFTGELSQIKANIIAEAELRKGRTLTDAEQENYKTMIDKLIGENKKLEEELAKLKATRSQATGEGRVRRTRTLDNLDKSIAQKENKIRVNKATVTQKLNNEIPVATSTRLGQFITEMKLLNPFSRLTDFASNTIKLIDNIVSTPINMAVDQKTSRLLKTQPVYSSSYLAKDRWKNLLINSWEKMKADLKIVAAGGDVETIEKYGGAQGLGSKAAGFTDVPFKAIYHEDGKFLAADVKAREMLTEELGKGNFGKRDIDAKRTEILENIDQYPDIIMNAEEYALNETFNNHNWVSEINKKLKSGMSPTGRLLYDEAIGRFSKVITNVATDIADRTGLGVARGIYNIADAMKSGKNLTTAERMAINKMITKGMIGVPLMYLGYKNWDKIEGEIRGVQQKYIDYGDLGKLGGPIAIFLHGASIGRAMNELSPDKVNDFVIASSLRLPFNTPFVSNVADISDVLDNPTPQAVAKYAAKKTANTFIPAIVREIATRMDTEKGIQTGMELEREKAPKGASTAEIFKGEFMSKIPGLRQQLPLKDSGRKPVTPGVTP